MEPRNEQPTYFNDIIHGSIPVSKLAKQIIDTEEFQRLRSIKQLGFVYLVYPNATHSRFEHSIGVYHWTNLVLDSLKHTYPRITFNNQYLGNNIKLDTMVKECIKIGGLCHDIGHGPFSHIFDDLILANSNNPVASHEVRSEMFVDLILTNKCKLEKKYINFIKSIINPKPGDTGWVYQIVCNYLNGIDVDKFDYITRDSLGVGNIKNIQNGLLRLIHDLRIDSLNNICYPKSDAYFITELFHMRYSLHKQIINNKTVKIVEYYVKKICELMEPILKLKESILDLNKFKSFTDYTIFEIIKLYHNNIINCPNKYKYAVKRAYKLYLKLLYRKFYKYVGEILVFNNDKITPANIIDKSNGKLCEYDFLLVYSKISYSSKPNLDNIFLYDKDVDTTFELEHTKISSMLSTNLCNEYITFVYCITPFKFSILKNILENYFTPNIIY